MGDPNSTIPALPARPPHATSSPASSLAPMPVTIVAAAAGAVPVVIGGADPAPAAVVGVAPAPAPVVGAGADAVHIVFAAAATAATRRDAIREEARRKKAQDNGRCLSKYPTSSCYFHMLWEVKRELDNQSSSTDSVIVSMVCGMREKMNKYWDLSYLKICIPVILDPRFKMKFLEFRLGKWFEDEAIRYISKVEKTFRKLFAEYSSENNVPILDKAHTVSNNELHIDDNDPWADWMQQQSAQLSRRTNELDKYLEEETLPVGVDLDLLQYWKMHSGTYPTLARMARDILAVPASTVASESAFSTAERVVSDYRSRLKSETIEALICLQDWLRSEDSTHDNIAGNVVGDELDCI